ncbi:hypothetical protein ACFPIJ_26075 [Dactylosporangium cerinum]|uniref:DUF4123 domain-containing protein n=1 Tax=Dactylosporangium cerinum TaxID=1434730 RepID=A0ABV9VZM6_9ACTN
MPLPSVSYANLALLADRGCWAELLQFAGDPEAGTAQERREAAYVIALEAPVEIAAVAVDLFAQGPYYMGALWEVVAHRPWRELRQHLPHERTRHLVAHTRILCGEDLQWDADLDVGMIGAPLCLLPWEAACWNGEFDVPEYNRTSCSGTWGWRFPDALPDPIAMSPDVAVAVEHDALRELNALSTAVRAYAFRSTAWEAAAAIGWDGPDRHAGGVEFADAYKHLVHLAAGHLAYDIPTAHEGRNGEAYGRESLWRALAAMAGAAPTDFDSVNAFVQRLRCVAWAEPDPRMLYYIHLAIEDAEQSVTWVLDGQERD